MKYILFTLAGFLLFACGPANGPYTEKHNNGNLKAKGTYQGGEKVGTWTYYWKSGIKQVEGTYVKDEPGGVWRYHDETGKQIAQGTYRNGKMWDGSFVRYVFGTKKIMTFQAGKEITP
ncbi:MAG: hypothetical protein O2954_01530 [bacterium]|nr:hypothetical protein [bacterium]